MKKVLSLTAALICLTAVLTGCSGDKKESTTKDDTTTAATTEATTTATTAEKNGEAADFIGKWQCEELVLDGEKYDNLWGADAYAIYQIEINEDNTGSFFSFLYAGFLGDDEPFDITWEKKDENSIIVTVVDPEEDTTGEAEDDGFDTETETMILTKEGDKLVLDMSDDTSDDKAYLVKVDSFTPIPDDMEMSLDFSTEGDFDFESDSSDTE